MPSLRSHGEEVNTHLRNEIQTRLGKAGVSVIEARISHLAYAQEIAQAMLQRQQAGAIIAARTRIVEGAVSMVEMALTELGKRGVVELDDERRRRWCQQPARRAVRRARDAAGRQRRHAVHGLIVTALALIAFVAA